MENGKRRQRRRRRPVGAAGIKRAGAGVSDSDGATSQSGAGVGHSEVWGKCLVDTIGNVEHT